MGRLLAFVFIALAAPLAAASDRSVAPRMQTPPAPAVPSRTWTKVRSDEGGFQVELPGEAKYLLETPAGDAPAFHRWAVELDRGWTAYFVGYADLSPARIQSASTDVILRDAVDGAVRNTPGSILQSETPITFQGLPGRDIRLEASAGNAGTFRITARIVLDGRRLYQQIAVNLTTGMPTGELDRFFRSFQLINR